MQLAGKRFWIGLAAVFAAIGLTVNLANADRSASATKASIAAAAEGAPMFNYETPEGEPAGYYQVRGDDDVVAPAYWMPAGSAKDAPADVQSTPAFESSMETGTNERSGELIYEPGTSVVARGVKRDCPKFWSYLWKDRKFNGRMVKFFDPGSWQNLTRYRFNDQASSIYNRKGNKATRYAEDANGEGNKFCFTAGSFNSDLAGNFYQDKISSIKIKTVFRCGD